MADFDGNGLADLAIGAPERHSIVTWAGVLVVAYGGPPGGFQGGKLLVLDQDTPGVGGTAELGDEFGAEFSTVEFDGDGWSDLAVGVPNNDPAGIPGAGAVNVLFDWGASGLSVRAAVREVVRRPGRRPLGGRRS